MNPHTVNLDIQFPDRMFDLKFAVGTEPLVRAYLKANGTAVTTTNYTGQMVYAEYKDSDSAVYIDSTATGSNYLDFQLSAAETLQISTGTEKYFLQFLVTDGDGRTVEWNRGTLTLRASPGTEPVDSATLGTALNWAGFSGYSNTGASGPYRAGTNVTFSNNGDGSVNINAAAATVADGDKGDITVSASGATWTIDDAAVTLAKMANLASGHLIGRHTTGAGVPESINVDGGLELNGANIRRSALTGDVTASAGSNSTTIANLAVTTGKIADDAVTADKLANTAVTPGSYTATNLTVDAQGRITSASSGSFLPLAGGTISGAVTIDGDDLLVINGGNISAGIFSGSGSGLTGLPAAQLTGDIPAASFGETFVEWTDRSFHLHTSAEVGWAAPFDLDNATRTMSADAVSSANTSAQTFVLRSDVKRLPRGFVAFKTTGTLTIDWVADDTTVADITAIELIGYSDITGSKTTLYTDTTTRNVGTINVPTTISIDRSAFSSTTVPTHIVLEITGTIEDGKKLAILHAEVFSE